MKYVFVDKHSTGIDVYVYNLNISSRKLTVRNYCSYCPSVLVVVSVSFTSRFARQLLDTVDINNPLDVRRFFLYKLNHDASISTFSIKNNPFFTRFGKPRRRLFDFL